MTSSPTDVVVTGLGIVSSVGIGIDAFWQSIQAGVSGIRSLEARDDGGPKPPADWMRTAAAGHWIGGPVIGFDAAQFVRPRKALKVMGRELQTAFGAAQMAMDQAGLMAAIESGSLLREQIATIFGSQMLYGPAAELLDAIKHSFNDERVCDIEKFGEAAMRDVMPLWMLKYLPNMAACHVGIAVGATGPNNTIVAGDVSATSALIESVGTLQRGAAQAVVCGATGSRIDETYLVYRGDSPVASLRDPIAHSSRPHAKDADGVVSAEAAGALMLELSASSASRGVTPLATVLSTASRFTAPSQGSRGSSPSIQLAIEAVLRSAGMQASDVGLLISHASGDPQRDASERDAIARCLPQVPLCMPIATCGHSGAATGSVHLVTAVLALQNSMIPAVPPHGEFPADIANRVAPSPRRLEKPTALVITHTSQGLANAVLLGR